MNSGFSSLYSAVPDVNLVRQKTKLWFTSNENHQDLQKKGEGGKKEKNGWKVVRSYKPVDYSVQHYLKSIPHGIFSLPALLSAMVSVWQGVLEASVCSVEPWWALWQGVLSSCCSSISAALSVKRELPGMLAPKKQNCWNTDHSEQGSSSQHFPVLRCSWALDSGDGRTHFP